MILPVSTWKIDLSRTITVFAMFIFMTFAITDGGINNIVCIISASFAVLSYLTYVFLVDQLRIAYLAEIHLKLK